MHFPKDFQNTSARIAGRCSERAVCQKFWGQTLEVLFTELPDAHGVLVSLMLSQLGDMYSEGRAT